MRFTVLTLFPQLISNFTSQSIISKAIKRKLIEIKTIDIRDFTIDKYKSVDDKPFGGGSGMILRVDIIDKALEATLLDKNTSIKRRIILLSPQGKKYNQSYAKSLTKYQNLILIAGHYEGFDERIRNLVDEEISIGDYILTGGEIPAVVLIDSVTRLLPGVLKSKNTIEEESFSIVYVNQNNKNCKLLEYPQYTKPKIYKGMKVPNILLSGNHQKISEWRMNQAMTKTKKLRKDLIVY